MAVGVRVEVRAEGTSRCRLLNSGCFHPIRHKMQVVFRAVVVSKYFAGNTAGSEGARVCVPWAWAAAAGRAGREAGDAGRAAPPRARPSWPKKTSPREPHCNSVRLFGCSEHCSCDALNWYGSWEWWAAWEA